MWCARCGRAVLEARDRRDIAADLNGPAQAMVFMALFYMYGTKVAALTHRTGIE